jgi:hypothetical protein
VPLSVAPARVSHVGRPAAAKVSEPVPPVAVKAWLYASPESVAGNEVVVTVGVALILREKALVLVTPMLSVTLRVKRNVPVAFGVPVNPPPAEMNSHEGSVAPASAKV